MIRVDNKDKVVFLFIPYLASYNHFYPIIIYRDEITNLGLKTFIRVIYGSRRNKLLHSFYYSIISIAYWIIFLF